MQERGNVRSNNTDLEKSLPKTTLAQTPREGIKQGFRLGFNGDAGTYDPYTLEVGH